MKRIGILGSTRGTHLTTLAEAERKGQLNGTLQLVITNKPDALILERARECRLRAQFLDPEGLSREAYDARVSDAFQAYDIDFIILMGYMRILSPAFVRAWEHKMMNVHPSLLPAHAGKMDIDVHESVLAAGDQETGCTVHYVTEKVDAGPIILQKKCPVRVGDTALQLKERVQQLEGEALIAALDLIV